MRALFCFLAPVALAALALTPACSCNNSRNGTTAFGDGGPPAVGTISVVPPDVTLDLMMGAAPPTASFMVILHAPDGDQDVTKDSTFTLADMTLGTMSGSTFTAGTVHGGSSALVANYKTQTGQGQIHVKVHGAFTPPDCPTCTFPPASAPPCASGAGPQVVYPPDGVLLPANMNVMTVQFLPGTGNMEYQLVFSNPATDVRVNAKCTPTVDTRGAMSGGCQIDLTPAMWDFIAKSNRGGDQVKVSVDGSPDGTCVTKSMSTVGVSFSEEDVAGGIYYWKSTVSMAGTGGHIWRKEFGSATPEEKITGMGDLSGSCYGCHFLSRDGQRMTINQDDDDSDDEYGDVSSLLVDVGSKTVVPGGASQPAGFQSFNADHTLYLGSNGDGSGGFGGGATMGNQFYVWDGVSGNPATPPSVTAGPAMQRVTMPDWSADSKSVVYVVPTSAGWGGMFGEMHGDDSHVFGGSLWTMAYSGGGAFGMPVERIHSMGENNYYPGYSPDGAFIIFNRIPATTSMSVADGDSFSNPKARVFILSTKSGAQPIDCTAANGTGDLSNSWPRWSPFVQQYKGAKLLWVTFSSTRDYGLLVRNQMAGLKQCYPPDSAEDPGGSHGQPFPANCMQPQIWMAAINLTTAEVSNPGDPSFPAFWLPFQDITTHNHTAQWTTTVVTQPPMDGGTCIAAGANCTQDPNNCCGTYVCGANGSCSIP